MLRWYQLRTLVIVAWLRYRPFVRRTSSSVVIYDFAGTASLRGQYTLLKAEYAPTYSHSLLQSRGDYRPESA